jgi:mRNA interferase RelE/StbE
MFAVCLTESFAKEFRKLEEPLRNRVKKKLEAVAEKPFRFFERLQGQELFKLRVGHYRLIAQISSPKQQITLLSIGHRRNVYEKI